MDEKRLESFIFAGELKDGEIATYDYTSANAEGCVYLLLMQPPLNIGEKEANSKKMREVRETIWSTSHIERAFDGTASFANMSIDRIEKEVATLRELVTRSQAQKAKDMAEYRKNS